MSRIRRKRDNDSGRFYGKEKADQTRRHGKPGDTVTLKLTEEQVDLIVEHTLIDDDLFASIHHSKLVDGVVSVRSTLDDLEELAGYVAAESNNTKKKKLQQRFDAISDAIDQLSLSYTEVEPIEPVPKCLLTLVKK